MPQATARAEPCKERHIVAHEDDRRAGAAFLHAPAEHLGELPDVVGALPARLLRRRQGIRRASLHCPVSAIMSAVT
jgi:hypothetical protein